jgi:hypothetical protein
MAAAQRVTKQTEQILQVLMSGPTTEWFRCGQRAHDWPEERQPLPTPLRMEHFGWVTWRWEAMSPSQQKRRASGFTHSLEKATEGIRLLPKRPHCLSALSSRLSQLDRL